ncbi:glycosyltransferase family 1 protein [Skermania sp. ID1734]|uniref:glycosyltransferase n=1 Tax=Skermania sp. ID1734 TaxID=2597516 RepID=UPI0011806D15|nr:glycosyltransferase [Skermania sp. ID1734]TSD93139.1 glycosyltransferase family 1 protein [Skermania sp. ID1734]
MSRSVGIIGTRGYPSYYGGFETLVRHLSPYLVERGWDVTVYGRVAEVVHDAPRDERVESVLTPGVESKSLSALTHGLTAAVSAARRKHDVALVMNVANGYFLPLLRARGIPSVVNVDGIEWERGKWGRAARAAFRGGARMTARWANHIVVDSQAIGDYWSREFGRDGTYIPYGGEDPGPTAPPPIDFHGKPYALMVARLVPENSVPEFLDAAEQLAEDWPVVLVGSSGHGSELDDRARYLSAHRRNFHWLGHLADDNTLYALWQNAGVYFHGHTVGGTNPALVQAMACGAPVLARDTVFNREVLGGAGTYWDGETAPLASLIDELLDDPRFQRELSEGARKAAFERFTWDGVCAAYADVLQLAAERK